MGRETHIVRFKVVSVRCPALPEGQQYTIYYRRGETKRSTPCYAAHNGEVDFSSMPEGAATIHFKSGGGGRRYAPKYIQFRIEEYTRGAPRRTVGECEADCSVPVQRGGHSARQIVEYVFRLYGTAAHIRVAYLIYPMQGPPLSFDGLVEPSAVKDEDQEIPRGELKHMQRGEAMSLLISLETMLERRRAEEAKGEPRALSKVERRLKELEERRRSLTGSEGLSTTVVQNRCHDCIKAQFVALARRYRNNYIGETAAYLRQMALTTGGSLTGGDDAMDEDTAREQLSRVTGRIAELGQQLRKLEEDQLALGRIQHKTDVTQELMANLQKVEALDEQLKMLKSQKEALDTAMRTRTTAAANSPLAHETKEINERVKTLTGEQSQLQAKIKHMTAIAASHVLSWARSKNPPEADTTTTAASGKRGDIDDLFSGDEGTAQAFGDAQRKQIMSALKGLGASAPPPTNRSLSSNSSSSGHRTPRDMFSGAADLPSMGDFGVPKEKPAKAQKHQDPTRPSDLGMNMFTASPPKQASTTATLPSMNDFMAASSSNKRSGSDVMSGNMFGGGGGATIEFGSPSPFGGGFGSTNATAPTPAAPDATPAFTLEPEGASAMRPAAPAPYNKKDDPFYDEMDDYTVAPEETDPNKPMFEFTGGEGGFNFGAAPADTSFSPAAMAPSAAGSPGAPPPRPTFDFGPSGDTSTFGGDSAGFTFTTGNPSYDFDGAGGGGGDTTTGTTNSANPFGSLPTYTFN